MNHNDKQDELAHKRAAFQLPKGKVYLDGNSLGPLPVAARERAREVVEGQWGDDLISSWNTHDWIHLPATVGDKIGALTGAAPGQVVCCDSISVNLFKVLSAALKMRPGRHVIATTRDNFPTDIYMVEGLIEQLSDAYELRFIDEQDIAGGLSEDIAVVMLTQVNFRTGFKHNMQQVTQQVHDCGGLMLWDLAHSAGAFTVELDACKADFAVGCTYKYLNGGPGAPAFIYVARAHQQYYRQPLSGWMGHASPFAFLPGYEPDEGIRQNLSGTPGIIGMSVLDAALSVFDDVSMKQIETKSRALMRYFLQCLETAGLSDVLTLVSPHEDCRGSQLAFRHPHSYAICQAWIDEGIIADFRAPDILRVGFAPLYLRFTDLDDAVRSLAAIVNEKRYERPEFNQKNMVT
ncbi:kynureninase [Alteromonas halophila]|uniref:Kynureninase n=2 Tax=Alteromonas halophila TaxID=516698 RepID=A0A918MUR0_9ALTE|nr:kynureninase [Alteromonas halophila]